jgi:hypothetical protein
MKKISFTLWLLTAIVLFTIVGAFAKIMVGYNRNDGMYIAASVFVAQNQELYKDFAFLQMPYIPLLYGNLYKLLGVSSYYFFIGKLVSFIFLSISTMTLFLLTRRALRDIALSLSIVALFLLNMTILNSATEVSNYIMPVACSLVSFYVFTISISENQIKPFGIALAGIFLAIAIGAKLTYATIVIPFIAMILFYPLISERPATTVKKNTVYVLFPFIAGIAIGLLPMLFFMSDTESFLFNNLEYHNINAKWRQITEFEGGPMTLPSKLDYAFKLYFQPDNLILILGILLGLGFTINSFQSIRQTINQINTGVFSAFLFVLVAVPTSLTPTPTFPQYFAMPLSFLFLLLIYSCSSKSVERFTLPLRRILLILVLVSVVYNGSALVMPIRRIIHRGGWGGFRIHDISINIRNILIDNGLGTDGKVATLSPLFVIESNLPIYPELSTGSFLYRIGDLLTPEQRDHFVGTSAKSIGDLFTEDPPAAILIGFEGTLDKPLLEYAMIHNYKKVVIAGFQGELYIRP